MDEDLQGFDREALISEIKRLRAGIREHRDSSGHELCWHHPKQTTERLGPTDSSRGPHCTMCRMKNLRGRSRRGREANFRLVVLEWS